MMGKTKGTLLLSKVCHYCGERGSTEDHIVPRADLPRPLSVLPYWFRSMDVVTACFDCNGRKSWFRSDCCCAHCTWAWDKAKHIWLPSDYKERGWIALQQDPSIRMALPSTVRESPAWRST